MQLLNRNQKSKPKRRKKTTEEAIEAQIVEEPKRRKFGPLYLKTQNHFKNTST